MAHKSLSIPEWHDLALQGVEVPTRILIGGRSMFPLVRYQKDYVSIIPVSGALNVGDIVLIADLQKDRYVLHRAWELAPDRVLTWGDNCDYADGWFPLDQIWGKAILVERGPLKIRPNTKRGLRWAKIWHFARKVYHWRKTINRQQNRGSKQ